MSKSVVNGCDAALSQITLGNLVRLKEVLVVTCKRLGDFVQHYIPTLQSSNGIDLAIGTGNDYMAAGGRASEMVSFVVVVVGLYFLKVPSASSRRARLLLATLLSTDSPAYRRRDAPTA